MPEFWKQISNDRLLRIQQLDFRYNLTDFSVKTIPRSGVKRSELLDSKKICFLEIGKIISLKHH